MQNRKKTYMAGLYMRLSREDGSTESSSITTQRKMLLSYAKENAFIVYDEYIDDGFSGTTFDRPAFKRMIQDIENKKINLVLTKDLSRLGRNYITAGEYTEIYFPSKSVRYIAINDGYDSENPYSDMAPFKNVINEMYARDISKKIRSSFLAKMKDGCYIGNFAPYGYQKDPKNKNHLVIDSKAACTVKEIFHMASHGCRPTDIAMHLNAKGVLCPIVYRCQKYNLQIENYNNCTHKIWTSSTISKLLKNVVYCGDTAQKKTSKISFKSKAVVSNPKEEWIIVEHTHEPIVSREIFALVQQYSKSRTCHKNKGFKNIFSGLVKCADCGKSMSAVGCKKKNSFGCLACGAYKAHGASVCTNHFIDYTVLYHIVLRAIQKQLKLSAEDKSYLSLALQKERKADRQERIYRQEIDHLTVKLEETDRLIAQLYEDRLHQEINKERFHKLLAKYEKDSRDFADARKRFSALCDSRKKDAYIDFKRWVDGFAHIRELDQALLFRLIERIEIGQGYYEKTERGKVKHQRISIYFKFAGTPYTENSQDGI
ncbi:MAG TPA: recombinase family protein [Candidatus Scatovicinus merdipullorum]|nr:recombinase family protein [Candidatus Scatovicinus merdipullorum]